MDHLVHSNATGAALVEFLRSSPDAIVQLVQGLKAASGMPQNEPAHAAASGLLHQASPAAAEAFNGTPAGSAMPAASMQAPADLHHTQQQASAVLNHCERSQLCGLGQGTPLGPSSKSQQQVVAGKAGTAEAAAQHKDALVTLLNQQAAQTPLQHPQLQSEQPPAPQAVDLCWGAPSPHSNNSATVPQHTLLPAPGLHELHAQPLREGAIQHLQAALLDVLKSKLQQQQQQQQQQLQAAGSAPAPQRQAAAAFAQPPAAPPGMPAQLNAAALAAACGIAVPQGQASTLGNGTAAAAPASVAQLPAAMFAHHNFGTATGVAVQQQQEQVQQQQAGSSMPEMLDRLRAAVISSTAHNGGSNCAPEQQRLLGMVDQLQSAWAQIGNGAVASSTDAAARAAVAGPHDAVAAAAAAVQAKAAADGMPDASGLYMLLEAVQQQVADTAAVNGSDRDAAGAAAVYGDTNMVQGSGYDAMNGDMYAAMNRQHAAAGWGDGYADTSMGYYGTAAGGHAPQQQGGSSRRKRAWAAKQQQQLAPGGVGLAGVLAAAMQQEGMRAEDAVDSMVEQKWLLKPRSRGKRQVKPNKVALTGELPPVADRWVGKARRSAGGGAAAPGEYSSGEDELWKPPRVRVTSKRRRTQGGSEDGAGASDKDSQDQQQQSSAGTGYAKGAAAAGRRGYGWQLLQQQQPDEAHSSLGAPQSEAAVEGADAVAEGAGGSCSDSGADGADDGAAAGDVTGDMGSADGGSEGGVAAGSASAATGAASSGKPRVKASRRDRWVPPTEEWTDDDGLKVWPKDTQISGTARVFYVAYKWVEDYWPNNLDIPDNHITAHPIRFYLDGHDTEVELTAKLRLYRKAVHLVISPYSSLSKKFVRKWLAGYAFDPDKQVLRAYLSTLKPKPPKLQVEEPDPEQLTAAAAAAAELCHTAAAQFAAGPVAADAAQNMAAQLTALLSMMQPKVKSGKDSKRGPAAAAAVQLPINLPLLPGATQGAQEQPPQADQQQQQQQQESAYALPTVLQATMDQLQQPAAMPLAVQSSATPQTLKAQQLEGEQAVPKTAPSQSQGPEVSMQAS